METSGTSPKTTPIDLLRLPAVVQRTGLSRSTIYALISAGKFPRQVKVTTHTSAWLEHEIDQFLAERVAERDSKPYRP